MRLLFFLVWKSWVSSPLRFVLTWVGVAIGVSIVAAIHVLDHNTILSQIERMHRNFGRVDFELRPLSNEGGLEARLAELRGRPDLARVGLFGNTPVQVMDRGKVVTLASLFGQAPAMGSLFGHWRVEHGKDLTELDPENAVLVAPQLAQRLGLEVGSTFEVDALPRAAMSKCIDGKLVTDAPVGDRAEQPRRTKLVVRGVLEPFRLARRNAGFVIVGRFALAARLARAFAPRFQVKLASGADPDRVAAGLREHWFLENAHSSLIGEDADERAFRNGVKVLGCLALVLGMFVIFHTLSHALAEKIRSVGILRALGATQAQVSFVFLVDALVLSVLGTATGIGLGIGLARLLGNAQITTLGLGKSVTTFEIPWQPLAIIAVLGVVMTMLGAAFPLFKIRALSPRRILYARDLAPPTDLMRGMNVFLLVLLVGALPLAYLAMTPLLREDGRGAGRVLFQATGVVGLAFAILLLSPRVVRWLGLLPLGAFRFLTPVSTFLVRKNLLRSPGRVASAVCGLTLVALAMLGMRAFTGSLKEELRRFASVAVAGHVFVKTQTALPEARWSGLRALQGVRTVLPLSAVVAMPFRCIGTDAAELGKPGGVLHGRPKLMERMLHERGMVITDRLARLRQLKVGDHVPVAAGVGSVDYQVIAIADADGFFPDERAYALADRGWLKRDFCLEVGAARRFSLRIAPGAEPAVRAAVPHVLGGVDWIRSGDQVLATHLADVDRDFSFFDILLWLLLLLAGVGQVNLITLTTIAREREIGVLRALGLTRAGFVATLLVEAVVVGFVVSVLTLVVGLPLCWILVAGLKAVSGLAVPFVLPWKSALGIAAISLAVSVVAAVVPALRAMRVTPAKAVRSTES